MQMSVRGSTYRFGTFSIDPAARELRRNGATVPVAPKVFECIVYLLENRQRAIGKDELVAAVWGQVSAGDSQIAQTILRARRTLDEDDGHDVIQTLPRFGYRWVAPVSSESPEAESAAQAAPGQPAGPAWVPAAAAVSGTTDAANEAGAVSPAEDTTPALPGAGPMPPGVAAAGQRRRAPPLVVLGVTALASAIALCLYLLPPPTPAPEPSVRERAATAVPGPADTFAVLPIDVQSLDADSTWLGIGLMEIVAAELSRGGLAVVPARNVLMLETRNGNTPDAALRETLGAENLVRVFVRRSSAGWTVRLVLDTGKTSSRKLEAAAANVVDAGKRAAAQALLLYGKEAAAERSGDTAVDELVGRISAVHKNHGSAAVRRLIEASPAPLREAPRVQIALADAELSANRFDEAEARYRQVLDRASAGDQPDLVALATVGLASVQLGRGDLAGFLRLFDTAIALRENAQDWFGLAYARTRRAIGRSWDMDLDGATADLAAAQIDATLASDRFMLARIAANQGLIAALQGRYAEASELVRSALPRFRQFGAYDSLIAAHAYLAEMQLDQLRPREALAVTDEAWAERFRVNMVGSRNDLLRARAKALLGLGRLQAAAALIEQIRTDGIFGEDVDAAAQFALIRALLAVEQGDRASVREQAGRAVAQFHRACMAGQRGRAWLLLVRALQADGGEAEADAQIERLVQWSDGAAGAGGRVHAAIARAEQAGRHKDSAAAERWYEQALILADAAGKPDARVEAAMAYATVLIDQGRAAQAKPAVGVLARLGEQSPAALRVQARFYAAIGQADAVRETRQRLQALLADDDASADAAEPPAGF